MDEFKRVLVSTLSALLLFPCISEAADAGGCAMSAQNRTAWVDFLGRGLANHDPAHASQMTKVAKEIIFGEPDALRSDLNAGLSPDALFYSTQDKSAGMSLITLAAAACQQSVVELLVSSGARIDGAEAYGGPLGAAATIGNSAMIGFLVQHGATVDRSDGLGQTPLEQAVRQHQVAATNSLLKAGANPNKIVGPSATIIDLVKGSTNPNDQKISQALAASGGQSGFTQPQ